jgi:hypothetical protein
MSSYIDLASRRAADLPNIPHTTLSDAELREIGWLINGADLQRRIDNLSRRCVEQAMEITRLRNRASAGLDAQAAWDAIKAKADEEGAVHGSDVVAILRSMGAR